MNKTRKNLLSVKQGGDNNNNNNWRPTRTARRPYYLNSKLSAAKNFKKYFIHGDLFDLSHYQNILITGSDTEKKDTRRYLNSLLSDLTKRKDMFKSMNITFNVVALVMNGILIVPSALLTHHEETVTMMTRKMERDISEIKLKLSINDLIQSVKKILEETDYEISTINPLVYKKAVKNSIPANIVERNGKLMVEIKNNDTNNRNNNDNIRRVKKLKLPNKYDFSNYDLTKVGGRTRK